RSHRVALHLSVGVRASENHGVKKSARRGRRPCYPLVMRSASAKASLITLSVALGLVLGGAVNAQWLNYPGTGTPRLPDGKPNLTAATPRGGDGKPDLSGIWEVVGDLVMPTDGRVRSKYVYNIAADLPDGAPFQSWAKALHDERTRALGVGAP